MPPPVSTFSPTILDIIRQLHNEDNLNYSSLLEAVKQENEGLREKMNNLLSERKNLQDAVQRRLKETVKPLRKRGEGGWTICKICQLEEVRVVVLPCKHLCLCMKCETKVDTCPVCAEKKSDCFLIMGPGEKAPPPVAASTQTSEPVSK